MRAFLLICLVNGLVYSKTLSVPFIWDDWTYIINNSQLDSEDAWRKIWLSFALADYWPVSYSILKICKTVFGSQPLGYHFVSLGLFISIQVLMLEVLKHFRIRNALLIVLLFALHPIQVETIAWIFQIKTLLSGFFFLLAIWIFIRKRIHWKILSILAFTASLLAKPTFILLPFSAVHGFVSLVVGSLNLWKYRPVGFTPPSEEVFQTELLDRILALPLILQRYLEKILWPQNLSFVDPPIEGLENPFVVGLGWLAVFAALALWFRFRKKLSVPFHLSLLGFLLCLAPVMGIFEVYFLRYAPSADHWAFGALGFFILASVNLLEGLLPGRWMQGLLTASIVFCAVLSLQRMKVFQSEEALYKDALDKNPKAWLSLNNLGLIYKREGRWNEALEHYRQAIEIRPTAQSFYNRALVFEGLNQLDEAAVEYQKALELHPLAPQTWNNLGVVQAKKGELLLAQKSFRRALELEPKYIEANHNLNRLINSKGTSE